MEKQKNQNTLPLKSGGKMVPKNVSCFINMNIITTFKNFKKFIKEEPFFFCVMHLP